MTPKEKAIELVDKYNELGKDYTRGVSMYEFAKQCALIAVDTVLWMSSHYATIDYWNQVKHEIAKL